MPPGGEIKLGKMGRKICCVILHETLSKCNVATIHIQLRVFTGKHSIGTPIFYHERQLVSKCNVAIHIPSTSYFGKLVH